MSNSQIKLFLDCPAKALAVREGEYEYKQTDDMLAGQFADVALTRPDELEFWLASHEEEMVATRGPTRGQLKAKFRTTIAAIDKVLDTPSALAMIQGKDVTNQVILTGHILDVPYRGMLDAINLERREIVDLKCMSNLSDKVWDGHARVPWYQAWGYWRQAALYRELARQTYDMDFSFKLLAISKQSPPDLRCISLDGDGAYKIEMDTIKYATQFMVDMRGHENEHACLNCDYCRGAKDFTIETGTYE